MNGDPGEFVDQHLLRAGKGEFEAGSVEYRIAGAAQRQARESASRLCARRKRPGPLQPFHLQVLAVICDLTAAYSKLADRTSARSIAAMVLGVDRDDPALTGGVRERASKAVAALAEHGVIRYRVRGEGPHAGIEVALVPRVVFEQEHDSAPGGLTEDSVSDGVVVEQNGIVSQENGVVVEQNGDRVSAARQHLEGSEELSEQQLLEISFDLETLGRWIADGLPVDWLTDGAGRCREGVSVSAVATAFMDRAKNRSRSVFVRWCESEEPTAPKAPKAPKPPRTRILYLCTACHKPASDCLCIEDSGFEPVEVAA